MTPSASGSRTLRGNGRVIPLGGAKQVVARYVRPTIRIRTTPLKAAWLMRVSVSVLLQLQQSADMSMDHVRGESVPVSAGLREANNGYHRICASRRSNKLPTLVSSEE